MTATLEQLTMLVGALGGIKDGITEAGQVSRDELQSARDLCIRAEALLGQIRTAATGETVGELTEEECRNLWRCVEEIDADAPVPFEVLDEVDVIENAPRFIRSELGRSAS